MPRKEIDDNEIRRLWALGYTYAEIGKRLGCSNTTIKRRIRPHLRESGNRSRQRLARSGQRAFVEKCCRWCHVIYQTNNPNQKTCGNQKCKAMLARFGGMMPRFSQRQLIEHVAIRGLSVESARAVGLSLEELKRAVEDEPN